VASGDVTRERIMAAAVKTFAERGYGSTSVRDIARRARIRVSTLYHYFRSKAEMYTEVHRRNEAAIRDLVAKGLNQHFDLRELTSRMIEGLFDFLLEHRDEARLAFREALGAVGVTVRTDRQWLGLVEGLMRPAVARGIAKEIDPALLMISVDAMVHWHVVNEGVYRALLGSDLRDPQTVARAKRHIVQVVLRSIGVE
jgi:AcrR family transcriptional regulator